MENKKLKSFFIGLGLVIGAILSVLQIWELLTKPRTELYANIKYSELQIPSVVEQQIEEAKKEHEDKINEMIKYHKENMKSLKIDIDESLSNAHTAKLENLKNLNAGEIQDNELMKSLLDMTLETRSIHSLFGFVYPLKSIGKYEFMKLNSLRHEYHKLYKGIWFAEIINEGKKESKSVILKLPNARRVRIDRDGEKSIEMEINNVISIGKMSPKESIDIIAWSQYTPSVYDKKYIQLTHEEGVGEINLLVPIGAPWTFLSKHSFQIILIVFFFIVLIYHRKIDYFVYKYILRNNTL